MYGGVSVKLVRGRTEVQHLKANRVKFIAQRMRDMAWKAEDAEVLAKDWRVELHVVQSCSAEASRRVRDEVLDPVEVGRTVGETLKRVIAEAYADGDRASVIAAS